MQERPQPVVPPSGICMQQSHLDVQAKRQTLGGRSISVCTTPLWVGSISANTVGIEVWKELMLQVRVIQIQLVGSTQLLNRGITGNIPYDLPAHVTAQFARANLPPGRFSSGSAKTNMPSLDLKSSALNWLPDSTETFPLTRGMGFPSPPGCIVGK